jgi:uncharacterized membrane protein YbhN (UPF0104 family)
MKKIYKVIFSYLFLYIIYKLYKFDLNLSLFSLLSFQSIIIYFFFFLLSIFFISIRWLLVLKGVYNISFLESLKITLLSFSLNTVSLSGAGELFKIFFWKKNKIAKDLILNCIILERIFSFLIFLFLISFFLIFYNNILTYSTLYVLIFIFLFLVFFLIKNIFFIKKIPYLNYYEYFLKKKILKDKIRIIYIFFLSFAIQVNFYVNLYLFSLANFKDISNYYVYIYYSLISIANSIPFFFSGFGIREFFSVIFSEYLNLDTMIYLNFTISIGLLNVLIALMYLLSRYIMIFFNTSFFYNTRKY